MTTAADPYDLQRFVDAQNAGDTYERVRTELRRGRKESHWMWFVFPQLAGLGHSSMSRRYAITSLDEARAYLSHFVLGPRLTECAEIVAALPPGPGRVFGSVDARKLQSSMTLFDHAHPGHSVFAQVLDHQFAGERDATTLARL